LVVALAQERARAMGAALGQGLTGVSGSRFGRPHFVCLDSDAMGCPLAGTRRSHRVPPRRTLSTCTIVPSSHPYTPRPVYTSESRRPPSRSVAAAFQSPRIFYGVFTPTGNRGRDPGLRASRAAGRLAQCTNSTIVVSDDDARPRPVSYTYELPACSCHG
jgi:hypothetical protein